MQFLAVCNANHYGPIFSDIVEINAINETLLKTHFMPPVILRDLNRENTINEGRIYRLKSATVDALALLFKPMRNTSNNSHTSVNSNSNSNRINSNNSNNLVSAAACTKDIAHLKYDWDSYFVKTNTSNTSNNEAIADLIRDNEIKIYVSDSFDLKKINCRMTISLKGKTAKDVISFQALCSVHAIDVMRLKCKLVDSSSPETISLTMTSGYRYIKQTKVYKDETKVFNKEASNFACYSWENDFTSLKKYTAQDWTFYARVTITDILDKTKDMKRYAGGSTGYLKTSRTLVDQCGTKRVVYERNRKEYVKKKDKTTGKYKYVQLRAAKGR